MIITRATSNLGNADYVVGKEIDTGTYWVEGESKKPIYRKIFRGTTALDGAQSAVFTLENVNLDIIVSLNCMMKAADGASWRPVPNTYYNGQTWDCNIYFNTTDNTIVLGFGSSHNGTKEVIVIIEYTKS